MTASFPSCTTFWVSCPVDMVHSVTGYSCTAQLARDGIPLPRESWHRWMACPSWTILPQSTYNNCVYARSVWCKLLLEHWNDWKIACYVECAKLPESETEDIRYFISSSGCKVQPWCSHGSLVTNRRDSAEVNGSLLGTGSPLEWVDRSPGLHTQMVPSTCYLTSLTTESWSVARVT